MTNVGELYRANFTKVMGWEPGHPPAGFVEGLRAAEKARVAAEKEREAAAKLAKAQHEQAERERVGKADAAAKARHDEAVSYVSAYTGTWGLPLDIRADRRWGTKYLRLTDRQVDALLAGKARDAERQSAPKVEGFDEAVAIAKGWVGSDNEFRAAMAQRAATGNLSPNMVAAILRSKPPVPSQTATAPVVQTPVAPVEPGMYRTPDGVIWKVQLAVHGSGKPYAKRLVVEPGQPGTFVYEPGAIARLRAEHRMTLDDAKAFGALYGVCCVCGATLTDEKSIAAGIGPVCAGRV